VVEHLGEQRGIALVVVSPHAKLNITAFALWMALNELQNLDINPVLRGAFEVVGMVSPTAIIGLVDFVVWDGYMSHICSPLLLCFIIQ
jgi:hypothetical protein